LYASLAGGLFICLPAANAEAFCAEIAQLDGCPAWVVGCVVAGMKTNCSAAATTWRVANLNYSPALNLIVRRFQQAIALHRLQTIAPLWKWTRTYFDISCGCFTVDVDHEGRLSPLIKTVHAQ